MLRIMPGLLKSLVAVASIIAGLLHPGFQSSSPITIPTTLTSTTLAVDTGTAINGKVKAVSSLAAYSSNVGTSSLDTSHLPIKIIHPHYIEVQADLVDGSYNFSYHLSVSRPGQMVTAISIATNQQNHTELLMLGTPTATTMAFAKQAKAPTVSSPMQAATANHVDPSLQATSGQVQTVRPNAAVGQTLTDNYTTTWFDPVGIVLADIHTSIQCTVGSGGNTVSNCHGWDYRYWFGPDGWAEYYHNTNTYTESSYQYGPPTTGVEQTWSGYQNSIFCAFQTTKLHYRPNEADLGLWPDGSVQYGGWVNTWADGGCSNLVHYSSVWG